MLLSDQYELAFEKLAHNFNYRLVFQAMTICSLSDQDCMSLKEIQAHAIGMSDEFYSYYKKSELFMYECKVTEKSVYADQTLNNDISLDKLRTFFKAIEKTGLITLDSRDNDLLYILNKDFADVLYNFARLQHH